MPISWMPKIKGIEEQIAEEQTRLWSLKNPAVTEPEIPITERPRFTTTVQPKEWQPIAPEIKEPEPTIMRIPKTVAPAVSPTGEIPEISEEPAVPFWQRALQVFATPFNWVDETIIKPGLALTGTALGLVPEVKRRPGEDFFDWKKRSWEKLETPGIDLNVPWSDEPWRIDIKGILEFAPWLLIPGAGQVGAGARAARGVAGVLGKLGTAGKALGYAVEFSPWGLVEKTAGLALRAGAKAIGKGTGAVSAGIERKIFGAIPEEKVSPAVQKLTKYFDEAVIPARLEFEKALPLMRGKQVAGIERVSKLFREGKLTPEKYVEQLNKATAVGGIRKGFAVKGAGIGSDDIKELMDKMARAAQDGFTEKDNATAFWNMMTGVDLPEPRHIRAFAQVFGEKFAESVRKATQKPMSAWDKIIDFLNIPRAVLASGDLSGTGRQGLFYALTRPQDIPKAFKRQLKYFASEKMSVQLDDAIRSRPLHKELVDKMGIEFTTFRKGAQALGKEEMFFSSFAEKLPFVMRSERAFTGVLNEFREMAGEAAYNAMTAQGATDAQFKLMGKFINLAGGRGKLPFKLEQYAPALNTVMFSAKYQMSTLQLPRQIGRMFLSKNPYMRKQAGLALTTFVGGGSALLGLIKATGGKVEIDPRSGDFGKIIINETRLDIWRGYIQYARFAAQMLTGQRKSAYGNMNQVQRGEIASRFLQSKLSPAAGLMLDLWKGETYMGEDLISSTSDVTRGFRERMLPLAIQDTIDAMEMSGINGLWTAAPAMLGVGVLTYVNDFVKKKEKIARDLGYETWDEIDPLKQREIQSSNAELQAAFIEFDRQVMGTAWGDYRLAGNAVEDNFKELVNKATAQYKETKDGYQFREKIGDAFTARRGGYAAREKMPQFEDIVKRLQTQDTAEALISLGPEQLAIRAYNEALYGEDMYDEYGDYRFDLADIRKDELRSQLGQEMFNYVEQYRGIKYEDLPAEFQELTKAKKVMKPYWDVYDWAVKTYSKAWAESSRGQSFISRMRKQMRLTNPQVAKYYDMFYSKS